MNELALFAGAGGGILGGKLLGWRCVCAVEIDPYAASGLAARQNDGCIPAFPIWDDVATFDGKPWRGCVDVVSGGFPCQDISAAGKGAGITGERSGLWREMARIIGEVRPRFVFVENSPLLVSRGLARALGDLAAMGYDARWGIVGAHHAGAPHKRDRIWVLAYAKKRSSWSRLFQTVPEQHWNEPADCRADVPNANCSGRQRTGQTQPKGRIDAAEPAGAGQDVAHSSFLHEQRQQPSLSNQEMRQGQVKGPARSCSDEVRWWATEPRLGRVAHGVANRVDRLRAIGNGQVPAVVRLAWETLIKS
jgi:DNA (cytosine-5)-methyltransferase 1